MTDKKILFILIGVAVFSIGSSALLYNLLLKADDFENPQLGVISTESGAENSTESGTEQASGNQGENDETQSDNTAIMEVPDFTVYDRDGNEVKLYDFAGKPIVLNFWASWCTPCKSEMPIFDNAYREYGEDVQFLMVNMTDGYQETLESALKYVDDSVYTFPVYYDTDSDAAATYGVTSLPTTYFLDEDGKPAAYAKSTLDKETLEKGIGMILPEE